MSKTPPLFADAFRIVNSKGIFPNIGDAATDFGDVISLLEKRKRVQNALNDAGTKVLELMQINDGVDAAKKEGYKLLKKDRRVPSTCRRPKWDLINLGGSLRIYLEYKATNPETEGPGKRAKNASGR